MARIQWLRLVGLAVLLVPPVAAAESGEEPTEPEAATGEETSSFELSLADWMPAFRRADPLQRDAALRRSIASLAVQRSENPQGIDLSLDAGADGGLWAWTSGASALGQGGLELDQASLSGRDAKGHRWALNGSGRLGLPGSTLLGGSSASVGGALYGSVAGNHQGRLYELETRYLALDEDAAASRETFVCNRAGPSFHSFVQAMATRAIHPVLSLRNLHMSH